MKGKAREKRGTAGKRGGKSEHKYIKTLLIQAAERAHREFEKITFLAPIWTSELIIYVYIFISSIIPLERKR